MLARRHKVCPFELGLDLSLWCDVVIGDYNYLFDPVVHLARFFETAGATTCFCSMRPTICPAVPGTCTVPAFAKAPSYDAKKRLGKGKSSLKNALTKVNNHVYRVAASLRGSPGDSRFGRTFFARARADAFDRALTETL